MNLERLDDAVAARLVDEFGKGGLRCVEFLETAHVLLCGGFRSAPRWGQAVAYCLREAMTAVLEAARVGDAGRWREVSRGVVAAGREFLRVEHPGCERDRLLGVLLARVNDLETFHREERLRRRRLSDVMVDLTGAAPISAHVSPVDTSPKPQDPWELFERAAENHGEDAATLYERVKVSDADLEADILDVAGGDRPLGHGRI